MPNQDATTLDRCVTDPAFASEQWAFLLEKVASQDETELEQATEALENCGTVPDAAIKELGRRLQEDLKGLGSQRIYWICTLLGRSGEQSRDFQDRLAAIACDESIELHARERTAWCLGEIGPLLPPVREALRGKIQTSPDRMKRLLQAAVGLLALVLSMGLIVGCDVDPSAIQDSIQQNVPQQNIPQQNGPIAGQSARPTATPPTTGATSSGVPGQFVSTNVAPSNNGAIPQRTQQTILIASFNIQAFGEKKVGDRAMAEKIAAIIRQFDVVGIQEVRAIDQTVIPRLLQYVNAQGAKYDYILGPRLGRSNSKEQYCYIYDTNRLLSSPQASYTVEDNADLLHREPLVARFVTRVPPGYQPFTFSLMNMHTDPDEVKLEMPVMHTVLRGVREYEWATAGEDDVLMMGDLNCEPSKFGPLAQVPGIFWIIQNQPTNTRKTKLYDNIIFDSGLTSEYTGRSGVLDFAAWFGISMEEALTISDHMPVWGEFTLLERPSGASPSVANQPTNGIPFR
jgi:endonuclease/exonuclease/phosphatase family metal-dependent hydrolase